MKLAIVIGFALSASPAVASDRLTEIERAFVVSTAASAAVVGHCDDLHVVKDSILKMADRLGVDEKVVDATRAAFDVTVDLPYDRGRLIPAVTQLFRGAFGEVSDELQANKIKGCAKWIGALRKLGLAE